VLTPTGICCKQLHDPITARVEFLAVLKCRFCYACAMFVALDKFNHCFHSVLAALLRRICVRCAWTSVPAWSVCLSACWFNAPAQYTHQRPL